MKQDTQTNIQTMQSPPHKDELFAHDIGKQFEFDERVASVFDDMLERSIPYYKETLGLIVDFTLAHINSLKQNSAPLLCDLGSSTGTTLLALHTALSHNRRDTLNARLVGVDNSPAMVEKARLKAAAYGADVEFLCEDILHYELPRSEVIIASYILQFIRPLQRASLLERLYTSLASGGILIVSEKMSSQDRILDRQMIERYLRYKREQGYTQGEITKKREALENVLIPFSLEENVALLKEAGFTSVELLFKWVNFGTLIARKA